MARVAHTHKETSALNVSELARCGSASTTLAETRASYPPARRLCRDLVVVDSTFEPHDVGPTPPDITLIRLRRIDFATYTRRVTYSSS